MMEQAPAQSAIHTRIQKPWLLSARILWLTTSFIALGLFIAGLPVRADEVQRRYRGDIQVSLTQNQKGDVVISPLFGSTASRAGVLEGDTLVAVNDVVVTSIGQADALLVGVIGTPVTVSVRTGNFPARQFTVTRGSVDGSILLKYGLSSQFAVIFVLANEILFAVLCLGIASVIFWYRSDDWMAMFSALIITTILIGLSLPVLSLGQSLGDSQNPYFLDIWFALAFGLLILFLYLFPSGQFASQLTLGLAIVVGLWLTLGIFNRSFLPWYLPRTSYTLSIIGWVATGVFALAYRYHGSDSFQRQQIRWIIWGIGLSATGLVLEILPRSFSLDGPTQVLYDFVLYPLGQLFKACLPLSIAFAILRYRLWNIEIIINRMLVFASLSILTMLGYLGTVFVLQALFTGLSNPVISFFATGLVAILFEPLRQRLQRSVNRWMYGERDDPYAVLTRLVDTLERTPEVNDVLPSIARTIGQTLKIPYVAILLELNEKENLVASFGEEMHDLISFPLTYRGETIGRLQLARRGPGEQFSREDLHLIENIVHQAGAAAQTVRLNAELIRSRTQIVNEREEERLRIRRDLHDELGPLLASQGLKLSAVRQVLRTQPEKAEAMVDDLIQHSQQTVTDIRRLVHGLRPPALDQLGLVEAVRDLVQNDTNPIIVEVSSPESLLPKLTAAVEVNAYRIVIEGLSNCARHAKATQCIVKFEVDADTFIIHIQDNGIGIPKKYRAGVGLRSMRLRAEEIGGQLQIESVHPHGTHIMARLPLFR
jgi:signal transduction histidine kinase